MISRVGVGSAALNQQVSQSSAKKDVNTEVKQESRVDSIKASIEEGSYKIDMSQTAKKMAEELMGRQ